MPKAHVPEPERHSMKGWGQTFADWDAPSTMEEASCMAQLAIADRTLECMTALADIRDRLARLERFMHEFVPGYREAQSPTEPELLRAIASVKVPH